MEALNKQIAKSEKQIGDLEAENLQLEATRHDEHEEFEQKMVDA